MCGPMTRTDAAARVDGMVAGREMVGQDLSLIRTSRGHGHCAQTCDAGVIREEEVEMGLQRLMPSGMVQDTSRRNGECLHDCRVHASWHASLSGMLLDLMLCPGLVPCRSQATFVGPDPFAS